MQPIFYFIVHSYYIIIITSIMFPLFKFIYYFIFRNSITRV